MDPEVLALVKIFEALEDLGVAEQARVLWWVAERFGILDKMLTMAARRYQ